MIVTDDQGYGDMSCHGNPWLQTPNLDRLYGDSVRLEDYHVDPVCTPTRASLMTGRYSSRVGAWAVTEGRQLLNADEVTMADPDATTAKAATGAADGDLKPDRDVLFYEIKGQVLIIHLDTFHHSLYHRDDLVAHDQLIEGAGQMGV